MPVDRFTARIGSSTPGLATPAYARGWRLCVALFAALSFALLVSTSATHQHLSKLSAQDCALCVAVADTLADPPALPALVHQIDQQAYVLPAVAVHVAAFASPKLLPPSCGPPHTSA
jgi:hypothetical protein